MLSFGLQCNEAIIKELQEKGILTPGPMPTYQTVPGGMSAHEVLLISDPIRGRLAVKIFNDNSKFNAELSEIRKSQETFKEFESLAQKTTRNLPIITKPLEPIPKMKSGLVIILSGAHGTNLESIIAQLPSMKMDKIREIFFEIGVQLGNLQLLMNTEKENFSLIHPDSHAANFMYDDINKQLYWIDTANITFRRDIFLNRDLSHIDFKFIDGIASRMMATSSKPAQHILKQLEQDLDREEVQSIVTLIENSLLAINCLFEGFKSSLKTDDDVGYYNYTKSDLYEYNENFLDLISIDKFITLVNQRIASRGFGPIRI